METAQGADALAGAPADTLDTDTIDSVIDCLLGLDPPPYILAADEMGLSVPVPAAVPLPPDLHITGVSSALELCEPADLPAIIEAWTRVRADRASQITVRLRRQPESAVRIQFIDARHRFGVYLGFFIGAVGRFQPEEAKPTLFRPRACSMRRDQLSIVRAIDPAVTAILGWTAEELVGKSTVEFVHPDDKAPAIANWMEMLSRPGYDMRLILRMRHRDGQHIWFEVTNHNRLADPQCGRVVTELVDISERMTAVEALRASEQLLRRLTETLPLGIIQIDADRRIVYRNELVGSILGNSAALTIAEQFRDLARDDRPLFESILADVLERGNLAETELSVEGDNASKRFSIAIRALTASTGATTGAIVCVSDITERVRLREELERRAKYDTLTRCHNRASIFDALDAAMRARQNDLGGIAVVFVDLDRFKEINDEHGHAAGDELLRLTGERLMASVRAGDIVGRLGGDEFLVVCPAVDSPEIALEIAQRIACALGERAQLDGFSIVPGSSVGVAWTTAAVGCDAIVAIADQAMYEAKRTARGPVLAVR
jgi:diguanylate cyclase (GGDEF)-like protein/PAS domain S-box-containing protein